MNTVSPLSTIPHSSLLPLPSGSTLFLSLIRKEQVSNRQQQNIIKFKIKSYQFEQVKPTEKQKSPKRNTRVGESLVHTLRNTMKILN